MIDVVRRRARQGARDDREEPRAAGAEGRAHRGRTRRGARAALTTVRVARRGEGRRRSSSRRRPRTPISSSRSSPSSTGSPRADAILAIEHQLDLDHRDRGAHQAAGAGDRDALHESRAGDAARRGDPRPRDERRGTARVLELAQAPRQDAGRSERLSRLRRESRADADDQRGGLLPHGRRRHAPRRSTR